MQTSLLTRTLRRLIRRDPAARLVDTTAGSSWGVIPTAMARENNKASMIGLCRATLITKIDVVSAPATYTSSIENRRSPTWNSVSRWCVLSPAAMLPNSVRAPMATTTPRALPAWTTVPISAHPDSSASGVPAGTATGGLFDGQRFAGEHGFVAFQAGDFQQPNVGRDDVAQFQLHDVAGHERDDVHGDGLAVAHHDRLMSDLGVQRLGRLLRPVLVDEPEPDRHGDDPPDDHGIAALTDEVGGDRGRDQQAQERGTQLVPEHRQHPGPVGRDRIGTPPSLPAGNLLARQTGRGCVELTQDLGRRKCTGRCDADLVYGRLWRRGEAHRALRPSHLDPALKVKRPIFRCPTLPRLSSRQARLLGAAR